MGLLAEWVGRSARWVGAGDGSKLGWRLAVRTGWRWRKKREDEESGGRRKKEVKPERENGKCLFNETRERESVIKNSFFFYM